jgi:hypothetical protein
VLGGVGITNSGFVRLFRTTVRDNVLTGGGGGVTGTGAGIYNLSRMEIVESTIQRQRRKAALQILAFLASPIAPLAATRLLWGAQWLTILPV